MSQYRIPPLNPGLDDAVELTDGIELLQDALYSTSSGNTRPAFAEIGTLWIDTSAPPQLGLRLYDGSSDRLLFSINTSTGAITVSGGIPEAPSDGTPYSRQNAAWAQVYSKTQVDTADALAMPKAGGAFTGPATVAADPTVPLGIASKAYVDAHSSAGASVTISATPPASPTAGNLWWNSTDSDGNLYIYYNDGSSSQWVPASAVPQGQLPVAVGIWYPGLLPSSATLMQFVSPDPWTLPAACAGSQGSAGTAATGSVTINIQKNGTNQGTVNFAAAATTATFTLASAVSFVAGDRLTLVAPASPDTTLKDLSITLKGAR